MLAERARVSESRRMRPTGPHLFASVEESWRLERVERTFASRGRRPSDGRSAFASSGRVGPVRVFSGRLGVSLAAGVFGLALWSAAAGLA